MKYNKFQRLISIKCEVRGESPETHNVRTSAILVYIVVVVVYSGLLDLQIIQVWVTGSKRVPICSFKVLLCQPNATTRSKSLWQWPELQITHVKSKLSQSP